MYNQTEPACSGERDTSQVEQDRRILDCTLDRLHDRVMGLAERLAPILPPPQPEAIESGKHGGKVEALPLRCDLAEKLYYMNSTASRTEAALNTLLNNLQV